MNCSIISKEDMKRFKALTTGNIVVMGRKTLESMPNGAPLPNRENVVLSSRNLKAEVTLCHTLAELGEYLRTQKKDIYIIGGETIYQELLDYCAEAEVTKIYAKKEAADAFFPIWTSVEIGISPKNRKFSPQAILAIALSNIKMRNRKV